MDDKKIVIEIPQATAVLLVFIVAGIILVYAAFTIPPRSYDLWPALNAGGIAVMFYLVALLIYVLRNPLSSRLRTLIAVVGLAAMSATAWTWTQTEKQVRWQSETLLKIRAVIGRGIFESRIPVYLLTALKEFHHQRTPGRENLKQVFCRLYTNAKVDSNIYVPEYAEPRMNIFVRTLDPDRIVLVGQETYVKGRDPNFKNFDGKTGMVQEQYTLTKKGVTRESEN